MNVILLIVVGLGLSFDVFAVAVTQGSVLGRIKTGNMALMCLIICGWQVIACAIGYTLSRLIDVAHYEEAVAKVWTLLSAGVFVAEGGVKLYILHHRKNVEERVQEMNFGHTCAIGASTSIYTLFAGFGCGLLQVSTVGLGVMICLMTIALVIIGVYVGFQNGELDKRIYRMGGILLLVAGLLVIFNYVCWSVGVGSIIPVPLQVGGVM